MDSGHQNTSEEQEDGHDEAYVEDEPKAHGVCLDRKRAFLWIALRVQLGFIRDRTRQTPLLGSSAGLDSEGR